uniref:Uncharacterized protein n=1 Tax=Solanum tuberosum TaxID=4113 RepID=M1DPM4_SOLTU
MHDIDELKTCILAVERGMETVHDVVEKLFSLQKDTGTKVVGESLIGLEIAFCSSVLIPEGKVQVGDEMEQSACRRVVSRSSAISPKDSKREKAEG